MISIAVLTDIHFGRNGKVTGCDKKEWGRSLFESFAMMDQRPEKKVIRKPTRQAKTRR